MQLKGLVKIFAVALILICLYQLSFTWFVRSHESSMAERAEKWVKAMYPQSPEQKYPGNKELQALYADTLLQAKKSRLQRLLDSTKNEKIVLGVGTYQYAKDQELMLGLDLQGGMNVTMEVGLDGLIKSLANNTKDPAFNKAIEEAARRKANSGADFISLFEDEYKKANPNGKLASLFAMGSNRRITYESTDGEVLNYIRTEAKSAVNNTYNILRTRIDKFGVAQPTINLDENKGIITIELAGVTDPERVRKYLQSTANLQFFEVYNLGEIAESYQNAEKALAAYLTGTSATPAADTTANAPVAANTDTASKGTLSALDSNTAKATPADAKSQAPISSILGILQPQQGQDGQVQFPAALGYVRVVDTGLLSSYLRMDLVRSKFPNNLQFMYGKAEGNDAKAREFLPLYAVKTVDGKAKLEGENVSDASQDYDERGRVAIKMNMDGTGTRIWAKMTRENVGKPIAIVMDEIVYSAPFVNGEIPNGSSQITGSFSVVEAQDLAQILKSGKLPAPAKIVQEQVVGPTLGQDAIEGGALAFLLAFTGIFVLMLVFYSTSGWIANIALFFNLLFTIGILSALGATLTAPGIAGLILTIGIAVDTNVIIFERIKEELEKGRTYSAAVAEGYKKSLAPVLDANVTGLITACILFYYGLGPVLGFATTQIIGILLSMFCGILLSRLVTDWWTNKKRHFNYDTAFSRKLFRETKLKFVEYRKYAYIMSALVLILGIGTYFNGFDQGVEFVGGRSYTIKFAKPQDLNTVRNSLQTTFGEFPVVKTIGNNSQLNITTSYMIKEGGNNVDSLVEYKLYQGLQSFLPAGTSFQEFSNNYKQSSQTVLPTISDDLKAGALRATIIALFAIFLYIFIRFRDWRYSLGATLALFHDALVVLIIFSYFRNIVPFPLEIDQHFIAALLTVIGFSINDTVIIFDRIREESGIMKGADRPTIINKAVNSTLSRTIMTSVTVFLTLLCLFIFGGEVTRGFAFAMMIGVLVGIYSTVFVAAPILVDMGKKKPLGSSSVDVAAGTKPSTATTARPAKV
ncbi:protein translocase subunit SecDF [Aridibaculum aurantiacum]|uniref:protein translocase subunit SecDF n=1 Tax=Aridibaculum aurantiacum TaxID=2810307 RepID=UPI001A97C3B0|nr:protein translocase subunit SecDF [Aridibaculum aurantiacum]